MRGRLASTGIGTKSKTSEYHSGITAFSPLPLFRRRRVSVVVYNLAVDRDPVSIRDRRREIREVHGPGAVHWARNVKGKTRGEVIKSRTEIVPHLPS